MSVFKRKVGDPLKLRNSLTDGRTDLFVRAFLSPDLGSPSIATVNLTHLADGVYGENSQPMPNLNSLFVKYKVYKDAGYTTLHKQYDQGFDIYEKEVLVPVVFPDDSVIGIVDTSDDVLGVVFDSEVVGVVSEDSLAGLVDDESAVGVISEGDITGTISESEISGTIQKC